MHMSSMLLSSLKAHEIMQDNASSNIANMNTPGYRALRTSFTLSLDGSVDVTTIRSDDPAPLEMEGTVQSSVDPAREFVDMIRARSGFEAVLNAISTREEMLDSLMDVLDRE